MGKTLIENRNYSLDPANFKIKFLNDFFSDIKIENAIYFFQHLKNYYILLTPDHKKFEIKNTKLLQQGSIIESEEQAGGQHIKHFYIVEDLNLTNGDFKIVSPKSIITVWGIFKFECKTELMIFFSNTRKWKIRNSFNFRTVFPK